MSQCNYQLHFFEVSPHTEKRLNLKVHSKNACWVFVFNKWNGAHKYIWSYEDLVGGLKPKKSLITFGPKQLSE